MRLGQLLTRKYSAQANVPIIHIPKANIYRFGDSNNAQPVFRDFEWTVNDGETWAVVGTEKTALFQTLAGHLRISPVPPPPFGLFPFLSIPTTSPPRDPYTSVSLVSFAHRPRGPFFDYTARYGAVREEDRITLRQSMFPKSAMDGDSETLFNALITALGLTHLLDLPLIALSNGQTRRARIVKALMTRPELLLLDEPLTGLDASTRPLVLSLLHNLHLVAAPRIILGLRAQDSVPDWIRHVLRVDRGKSRIEQGGSEGVLEAAGMRGQRGTGVVNQREPVIGNWREEKADMVLVDLKNVSVQYHERKVLSNINWTICEGERWHLQGANGSGKTTLLSLLTGDHPQSYTQTSPLSDTAHPSPSRALTLFTRPRSCIPTAHLRALIGIVSPELANAFPRRGGMTVWEAVGTGFEGGFVSMGKEGVGVGGGFGDGWRAKYGLDNRGDGQGTECQGLGQAEVMWRVRRCWEVLNALGPDAWNADVDQEKVEVGVEQTGTLTLPERTKEFSTRAFTSLTAGEQSVVLLMRAVVGQPPLVLLDEVWSGMEEGMIRAARRYLRGGVRGGDGLRGDQAVVVVSHWEEEVPWGWEDGVRRFRLEAGKGWVVEE